MGRIKLNFRDVYKLCLSEETRFKFYKLRNLKEIEALKTKVNYSEKGNFSLRNYYKSECLFVHITKSAGTSLALSLFGDLPSHYTAIDYRVIFGRKDFDRFFKFSFVRNPWDRLYSAYSYLKGGGWYYRDAEWAKNNLKHISHFPEFVMDWLSADKLGSHKHFWPQSKFICDTKNRPLINYLGYFESVDTDFEFIKTRLNLTDKELRHTNASDRAGYTEVYTPEMIAKVEALYHQDIHNFGYQFEGFARTQIVDKQFKRI